MRKSTPAPIQLVNHHGDPVLMSEALYEVRDPAAARRALASSPELQVEPGGRVFVWIDPMFSLSSYLMATKIAPGDFV